MPFGPRCALPCVSEGNVPCCTVLKYSADTVWAHPAVLCSGGGDLKQSMYRPLDIFSFSTCAVVPAGSHAANDSLPAKSMPGTFSNTLLMTSSTKGATVQLLQKSVKM